MQDSAGSVHAVVISLEGRLALGVILIDGIGLLGSLEKLNSKDAAEVRDAWIGMIDSTASVIGGLTLVWETAAKASIAGRLGKGAVERSVAIHTLRAAGHALGAVAGVANAIGQFAKGVDSYQQGYSGMAVWYALSSAAFAGTVYTGTLPTAGAIAERQIAKGVTSAVMQRIAARYGAVGVATLMNISLSGWGLILLGAAVACEVGAVVLTPTEVQKWVQRRYFGYGKGSEKKFTDWGSELSVLGNVFVTPASKSDAKQTPQSGYGIVHSHAVFHSHETRANYGNVHCYKKAIEDGKVKMACQ